MSGIDLLRGRLGSDLASLNSGNSGGFGRLPELRQLFSRRSFDQTTVEGRSRERYRRVLLTAASSLTAKGITALTMLVSVPLTVSYLGAERYGLWMTLSSLIALFSFADLGIGNGLVNSLAEAQGRGDREAAVGAVSSAFVLLMGVAVVLLAGFAIVHPFTPWSQLFRVSSSVAANELNPSIVLIVTCFVVNIPLGLVERVRMGYQEGFANSLWQSLGSLGGLLLVLLAIRCEAGLPWLVLAMAGTPVVATACNAVHQFFWRRPWLRPRLRSLDRRSMVRLAHLGGQFLVIQILTAAGLASDNLIIARLHGVANVAGYAVVQKLYSLALLPQFMVAPLWPAFGEAIARQDFDWARRALRRAVVLSVTLAALIAVPLFFSGQHLVSWWAGAELLPSRLLLAGFTCQMILGAYGGAMTAFLNSSAALGRQVLFYGFASVTAILLKIVFAAWWQIDGVSWATVLAYGLFYAIPAWLLANRILRGD